MVNYLHKRTTFDDFASVSGWSEAGNLATAGYGVSRNTTSTYIKTGNSSMRLYFDYDADTNGLTTKTYSSTTDMTPYDEVWVNYYVDDENDLKAAVDHERFRLYLGNDGSNYFLYSTLASDSIALPQTGWNVVKWTIDSAQGVTGAPDLSTVDYVSFISYDNSVSDYNIYIDSIWLVKTYTFAPGLSALSRSSSYNVSTIQIPRRKTPIHQRIGQSNTVWSLSCMLIDDTSGNVSYNTERDKLLDASQLDDLLGQSCILETGETSASIEFRDVAGTEDGGFDMNHDDDEIRKWIYVPTVSNLKTASVYLYVKETGSDADLDMDITVNDVVHTSIFASADIGSSYAWKNFSISPEILVEGYNEILMSEGTGNNDGSDYFSIGIDTDDDYGRSQLDDEGGGYADETGEYMIYLLCTYEDTNPYIDSPKQVLVTDVKRSYPAGTADHLTYTLTLVEDKI